MDNKSRNFITRRLIITAISEYHRTKNNKELWRALGTIDLARVIEVISDDFYNYCMELIYNENKVM